ncbi:endonuclease III domain-containing protein [Campylobacter sp. LMG 7929]|uniref:endonuclease III domain-containing protein n=1 Tax=unclassified Campylobacter TaxID=2593542 RepID=UPI0021E65066|nr:endonuclease III domain-containing protein [Campylobacter sp. CNRCH_2015_0338h]MCR8697232.1 endonuclease III domain-containing protein [Campylobacter sp. LMG 7929]HEC1763688.1 endonuclease III domain-containing protein [Campylobacter lari]MCV3471667.1 endonuclease III domain-containing protein [Campylobacter sp. CNRCH_2015_0338h]HEC1775257.1 endonuclease III domain-containing protein [Campylobacter lari]HEC1790273.1 endonuclease III domain-containing protein [Campylobacter lari]
MSGYEIFKALVNANINYNDFEWLENNTLSEFEILISVVLTQNTNWKNVLKALINLKQANITKIEDLLTLSTQDLALLIKPSGFYNTKAKYIKNFTQKYFQNFNSFELFKEEVDREWLLGIKGLGQESVDGILNYICKKEVLVVDAYSAKIANYLGYECQSYDELADFLKKGIAKNQQELCVLLKKECKLYELYQIFHALIVSFCKTHFQGKKLSADGALILDPLKF